MALLHHMMHLMLAAFLVSDYVLARNIPHEYPEGLEDGGIDLDGSRVEGEVKGAASALMSTAVNYLESENKFKDFERILKSKEESEIGVEDPTTYEAKTIVTSLVMLRNQVAMFAGKKGREAFESNIRGVAADLYLNLMQAIYPTEGGQKPNFLIRTLVENAGNLINWSEQTIQLEWPDNKQMSQSLNEASLLVKNVSTKMMQGQKLSDEEKRGLQEALEKIEHIEAELRKPTAFKLCDLAQSVLSRVGELLRDIVAHSDDNPVDMITKQVNVLGDLLTITWKKDSTVKRILKTMLLGLVRTQVPKFKQFADWLDNMAREAHERLYAGEGFPEHMLYLLE